MPIKWGHPLSWLVIGEGNSASVYNSSNTWLVPWTKIESHNAITTQPKGGKEKYSGRKEYKESNMEKQNFEEQV